MTLPSEEDRAAGRAPATFIAFAGLMSAVIALSIDAVLPALDTISDALEMGDGNERQLIVTFLFLGFGASQLVYGTLSDMIGRKPAAMIGWAIFVIGSLLSMLATSPEAMYLGRALQGFGAGGPRVVVLAIIRDLYAGRQMARVQSLVMMIFILVPMIAPLCGQIMEWIGGWRSIFALFLVLAAVSGTWYLLGVPETLPKERRNPLGIAPLGRAFGAVFRSRASLAYTVGMGLVFGGFVAWLGSSQQVLEEGYALGEWFPAAFAGLAFMMGFASWANSRLVMRLGMRRLTLIALGLVGVGSSIGLAMAFLSTGLPPFVPFLVLMSFLLFPIGILFANLAALAMEPLGAVAGTGASVVQFGATLMSVPIGWAIGQSFDGNLTGFFAAWLLLAAGAYMACQMAERYR